VLDVLALVPASGTSTTPIVYSRADGGWQLDEEMRAAMVSTNPPPIVMLDAETAKNVIEQVDSYFVRKAKDSKDSKDGAPAGDAAAGLFDELQVYSEFGDLYPIPTVDALYAA